MRPFRKNAPDVTEDPPPSEKERLRRRMLEQRDRYHRAQQWWSMAFHVSVFTVPGASLATTILAALKVTAVATTIVSGTVTFVAAIAASGRFKQKWKNARQSRGKVDALLLDLDADGAEPEPIRELFKQVIADQDAEVLREAQ